VLGKAALLIETAISAATILIAGGLAALQYQINSDFGSAAINLLEYRYPLPATFQKEK
jgi:hypothetical protein